jgi:penicillin amidase
MPVEALFERARSGSNSVVVSAARSATGGALIANDPHLGLQQPNLWILGGYRSPSGASVGMMYPGIPVVLIGRNEWIAWGGTNMQGLSSSLFDVSSLEESAFTTRREKIRVRLWFDRTVEVRDSEYGPVISDAPLLSGLGLPTTALRWRGHQPSDEATTMLRVNRARTWEEFRRAFETYAVSGQNLVYADAEGNIGQLLAIEFFPAAGRTARQLPADPNDPANRWEESLKSTDLPAAFNPEAGYLVSCNNTPVRLDPGLTFLGNSNDRVRRFSERIEAETPITVEDLMRLQRDTFSESSLRAARGIADSLASEAGETADLVAELRAWDGRYDADSRGAVAYQLVLHRIVGNHYRERYGERIARYLRSSAALHDFVVEDLASGALSAEKVRAAARSAASDFARGEVWGDLHRIRVAHFLGSVPVLGARYRYGDFAAGGSSTTVRKSAHSVTNDRHFTTFGQNSRHVSDLADADANWFVLLGGQDGWFGSENLLDQVSLYREGRYVRIPLREETVRAAFPHRMVLR